MNTTATQPATGRSCDQPENRGSEAQQHSEWVIARTIEEQTAKLPSDLFLWAAGGAIATSLVLELTGHEEKSHFIGQWVAPFLLLGVYNKLVKQLGSDRTDNKLANA